MDDVRKRNIENSIVFVSMEAGISVCRLDQIWAQESHSTYATNEECDKAMEEKRQRYERYRQEKSMIVPVKRKHRIAFKTGVWQDWEKAKLKELASQGKSDDEIAEVLCRSKHGVLRVRKAMEKDALMLAPIRPKRRAM